MGRPKKKAADKRSETLWMKLTKSERAEMEKAANAVGMDLSTFVRMKILELIRKKPA